MEHDLTIEEMLDMPVMGEVQMNLANMDRVGQDEFCKVVSLKNSETPKQDNEIYTHGGKIPCELFCVTGKDSDCIDLEDLH